MKKTKTKKTAINRSMNEEVVYTIHPGQHCEHDATRHRWCHAEPKFKPLCQHPTSAAPMPRTHSVEQNDTIHSKFRMDINQQIRHTRLMSVQCWAIVSDATPTPNQHRANVSCLLGITNTNGRWLF